MPKLDYRTMQFENLGHATRVSALIAVSPALNCPAPMFYLKTRTFSNILTLSEMVKMLLEG